MVEPLEELVRRVAGQALAQRGRVPAPSRRAGVRVEARDAGGPDRPGPAQEPRTSSTTRPLVAAADLDGVPDGGMLAVPRGAAVTPLAREEAHRRGIRLAVGGAGERPAGLATPEGPLRVAVGSDHAGFGRKQDVLVWVREAGHRALDLGTRDERPVDYPDVALAVAEAVAEGRADAGIVVDGAGIGSAMAANKVAGVRAATCWDERSARNAREHNLANVLAIGARLLDAETAFATVRAFLATPYGGDRHLRRVEKIHAIERRARAGDATEPGAKGAGSETRPR